MEPIHFFRAGRHTALDGREVNFSQGDLEVIASAYDPARHEAPLVVGHPKIEAPAYGWVAGIVVKYDGLYAKPRDINPEFAELVKSGAYKKVSGSFYAPNTRGNPTPGSYHLRHVGFLGGTPPAVKGLRPIQFAADGSDVMEFEEGFIDLREYRLAAAEKRVRRSEERYVLQRLAQEGRLVFPLVEPMMEFMETLDDDGVMDFADAHADDGKVSKTPRQWFFDYLKSVPPFVTKGEIAKGEAPPEPHVDFSAPEGYETDPARAELHNRAMQYMKAMGTNYETAARAVDRGETPKGTGQ